MSPDSQSDRGTILYTRAGADGERERDEAPTTGTPAAGGSERPPCGTVDAYVCPPHGNGSVYHPVERWNLEPVETVWSARVVFAPEIACRLALWRSAGVRGLRGSGGGGRVGGKSACRP